MLKSSWLCFCGHTVYQTTSSLSPLQLRYYLKSFTQRHRTELAAKFCSQVKVFSVFFSLFLQRQSYRYANCKLIQHVCQKFEQLIFGNSCLLFIIVGLRVLNVCKVLKARSTHRLARTSQSVAFVASGLLTSFVCTEAASSVHKHACESMTTVH